MPDEERTGAFEVDEISLDEQESLGDVDSSMDDVEKELAELESKIVSGESPEKDTSQTSDEETQNRSDGAGETSVAEPKQPQQDAPEAEADTGEMPPAEKARDTQKDAGERKLIEINDEYIKNADKKDAKILEKYKGESMSENVLKALIHGQRLIGKRADELFGGNEKDPVQTPWATQQQQQQQPQQEQRQQAPTQPVSPEQSVDFQKKASEIAYSRIKAKYDPVLKQNKLAALPDSVDQFETSLKDINFYKPLLGREMVDEFYNVRNEANTYVQRVHHIQNNFGQLNESQIANESRDLVEFAEKRGLDVKSLSIDISDPKQLANLATIDGNEFDPSVVQRIADVPVIVPGALKKKFFAQYAEEILDQAVNRARGEGVRSAHEKPTPVLLGDASAGKPATSGKKKTLDLSNLSDIEGRIDTLTEEEVAKVMGNIERKLGFAN